MVTKPHKNEKNWIFYVYIGANNELFLTQLFYMEDIERNWLSEGAMSSLHEEV